MKLTIHNLCFERNDQTLFSNLHCVLESGELLQICGANGSGKSTLLRMLATYIEPQEGTICWQDKCIYQQREIYLQQLCYIGHQNGLKTHLTVWENLQLHFALTNKKKHAKQIEIAAEQLGLAHLIHVSAFKLSAGQARRLALAKLLLQYVPLWILDEPMTALDKDGQQLLSSQINQHRNRGGMVVLTSHQHLSDEKMKIIQLGRQYA